MFLPEGLWRGLFSLMERVAKYLLEFLTPDYLYVMNQSDQHKGHIGKPHGDNTHFYVVIVSSQFEGKTLVNRHKMVYAVLDSLLKSGLHALKLSTFTPQEFEKQESYDG